LVDAANQAGGDDNITVIVADIVEGSTSPAKTRTLKTRTLNILLLGGACVAIIVAGYLLRDEIPGILGQYEPSPRQNQQAGQPQPVQNDHSRTNIDSTVPRSTNSTKPPVLAPSSPRKVSRGDKKQTSGAKTGVVKAESKSDSSRSGLEAIPDQPKSELSPLPQEKTIPDTLLPPLPSDTKGTERDSSKKDSANGEKPGDRGR
jgi:hypothetical protein